MKHFFIILFAVIVLEWLFNIRFYFYAKKLAKKGDSYFVKNGSFFFFFRGFILDDTRKANGEKK